MSGTVVNGGLLSLAATTLLFVSCSSPATRKQQANALAPSTARSESRSKPVSPASTFSGQVVSIEDGDTIVVLDATNQTHRIRLQGIDAPEDGQAYGNRSRRNLWDLISGKEVTVEWSKRDRYRRLVGKVLLDGSDVCLEQIKAGMAWHYKYYQSEQSDEDRERYANAESEARATKRGLWSETDAIPPWDFRRGH